MVLCFMLYTIKRVQAMKISKTLVNVMFILSIFLSLKGYGQYYVSGNDPAGIHWKQINTDNFQIVFPDTYEIQAQKIASILEKAYSYTGYSMKVKPKKISVLLHNQTAVSNGMVAWAPKRMEWYTPPARDNYAQDWFEQLAIHEHRHVVQIEKLNQGMVKILTYLFGQQATAAFLGLYVPVWFLEGDAVATETALSNAGRGRLPDFEKDIRTQVLEKKIYSYDKAVYGSYKDYVPNHYILGYQLVAHSRAESKYNLWSNVLNNVSNNINFGTFNKGLKRTAGKRLSKFYKYHLKSLQSKWNNQGKSIQTTDYKSITTSPKRDYVNYYFPQYLKDSNIVAYKTSYNFSPRFVLISGGSERVLHRPGYVFDDYFSVSGTKIYWSEIKFDKRWEHRSFADIHVYDSENGKHKKITNKSRLYMPSVSSKGDRIAATHITENNNYSIALLDADNGSVLTEITTPENNLLLHPSWSADDKQLVMVLQSEKGKEIVVYDFNEQKIESLMAPTYIDISHPKFYGSSVIFNGAFSGIDNIYILSLNDKSIKQITSVEYAARNASIGNVNGDILFSNYTANGFEVASISPHQFSNADIGQIENNSLKLYEGLASQEKGIIDFNDTISEVHPVRPYSKGLHLFNFHSWAPLYSNLSDEKTNLGLSILSQNLLGTATAEVGFEYDQPDITSAYSAQFNYTGLYPCFGASIYTGEERYYYDEDDPDIDSSFLYNETELTLSTYVPLNWTQNHHIFGVIPLIAYDYNRIKHLPYTPERFFKGEYSSITYQLQMYHYTRSANRNLYPPFGQSLLLSYEHTPEFAGNNMGNVFAIQHKWYLPSVFKNHSFRISLGYQNKTDKNLAYSFSNILSPPRGWHEYNAKEYYNSFFNYSFPLFYPDAVLPSVFYIKRTKANLFYDMAWKEKIGINLPYDSSIGLDVSNDMYLFRLPAPFDVGVRNVYIPNENSFRFFFLLSLNISEI